MNMADMQKPQDNTKSPKTYNLSDDVITGLHQRADAQGRSDSAELDRVLRKVLKLPSKPKGKRNG